MLKMTDSYFCISEAIQSRCAILRYTKLSDAQILSRLMEICDKEKVGLHFVFLLTLYYNVFMPGVNREYMDVLKYDIYFEC